jgi:hypothetical protein
MPNTPQQGATPMTDMKLEAPMASDWFDSKPYEGPTPLALASGHGQISMECVRRTVNVPSPTVSIGSSSATLEWTAEAESATTGPTSKTAAGKAKAKGKAAPKLKSEEEKLYVEVNALGKRLHSIIGRGEVIMNLIDEDATWSWAKLDKAEAAVIIQNAKTVNGVMAKAFGLSNLKNFVTKIQSNVELNEGRLTPLIWLGAFKVEVDALILEAENVVMKLVRQHHARNVELVMKKPKKVKVETATGLLAIKRET